MLLRNLLPSTLLFLCQSLIQLTKAQTSTASWQFPLQDGFTIDVIDTIILQWTSNYKEAWLLMWCQKNGPGSEFRVQPNGSFPYILFSQNLAQRQFLVACHAQLAVEQKGAGVDGPVGITWTSRVGAQAQTFSLAKKEVASTTKSSTTSLATTTSSFTISTSPSAAPSPTDALPITTSSSSSVPTNTPTLPPSAPSSNLPLAIGLGLGLSFLLILLSALIYLLFIRRPNADGSPGPKRWTLSQGSASFGRHELEDEPRRLHEMDGKGNPVVGKAELDAAAIRAELDGGRRETLVGGELPVDEKRTSVRKSRWGRKENVYEMP